MKTTQEIKNMMFATLHELQSTEPNEILKTCLVSKLQTLVDILDEEVPEEYYNQLEEFIIL